MRSRLNGIGWLEQVQRAPDDLPYEIKFNDFRCVPERDKSAFTILRDSKRYRICGWNGIAFRKIESLFDSAGGGIEQQNVVGEIIGNQQLFRTGRSDYSDRRGIRHALIADGSADQFCLSAGGQLLKRKIDHAFGSYLAVTKAVDSNATADRVLESANRI